MDWIADRLAVLCTDDAGRRSNLRFHHHCVRAALLVDLGFRKRLTRYLQTTEVDTTRTGHAAADLLLAHIDANPSQTMEQVLDQAKVSIGDLVAGERACRWSRPTVDLALVRSERARLQAAADGDSDSPQTSALALLADSMAMIAVSEPGSLLADCADVAWLVSDGVEYVGALRAQFVTVRIAGRSGGAG